MAPAQSSLSRDGALWRSRAPPADRVHSSRGFGFAANVGAGQTKDRPSSPPRAFLQRARASARGNFRPIELSLDILKRATPRGCARRRTVTQARDQCHLRDHHLFRGVLYKRVPAPQRKPQATRSGSGSLGDALRRPRDIPPALRARSRFVLRSLPSARRCGAMRVCLAVWCGACQTMCLRVAMSRAVVCPERRRKHDAGMNHPQPMPVPDNFSTFAPFWFIEKVDPRKQAKGVRWGSPDDLDAASESRELGESRCRLRSRAVRPTGHRSQEQCFRRDLREALSLLAPARTVYSSHTA